MSDLIDRRSAIDFIDAGHLCNPNEPRWSDNEVVNFLKSRPSAEPEPQWISVEERLPELDQCNLVTMQHANGDIDVVIARLVKSYWGSDNDFEWESDDGEYTWDFKNAFAWCELPEPYRAKEKTE